MKRQISLVIRIPAILDRNQAIKPDPDYRRFRRGARRILMSLATACLLASCTAAPGILLGTATPQPSNLPDNDPWATQPGWHLAWNDEFSGTGLDTNNWVIETGGGGWGNNELEYYQAANATIGTVNGASCLVISAKQENVGGSAYTSSRLTTQGKASWSSGRMEARLKLPYGQGIWPAFWMLGTSISTGSPWPRCGEIDIMEMVGGTNTGKSDYTSYGTIHWWNESLPTPAWLHVGASTSLANRLADSFHIFGIEWNSSAITWYLDGQLFAMQPITGVDRSEFVAKPFFLLLNLAVGGDWPGAPDASTIFPQTLAVDWVRVYQQ